MPLEGRYEPVDTYEDAEDLGDALLATAAVPWLLCWGLAMPFRGGLALDGGLTTNCPAFRDGVRPQIVVSWDELDPDLCARTAGLYFSGEEMVQLAVLGIDAGYALARGERANCVALVPAGGQLPPACDPSRAVASVSLSGIFLAALETYNRAIEKRAVRRYSRPPAREPE